MTMDYCTLPAKTLIEGLQLIDLYSDLNLSKLSLVVFYFILLHGHKILMKVTSGTHYVDM